MILRIFLGLFLKALLEVQPLQCEKIVKEMVRVEVYLWDFHCPTVPLHYTTFRANLQYSLPIARVSHTEDSITFLPAPRFIYFSITAFRPPWIH